MACRGTAFTFLHLKVILFFSGIFFVFSEFSDCHCGKYESDCRLLVLLCILSIP
jgi:hypothetical protein